MTAAGARFAGSLVPRAGTVAAAVAVAAFLAVGFLGADRYLRGYWLYRGFPPPRDPAFVTEAGTEETISVQSAALGGRRQQVVVYLPPGYASQPTMRYPVFYLLHGFPGRPAAFIDTVRMGVLEDTLVASGRAQPLILVMPFGSTGTFTDKEWVDGYRTGEGWATFVARDLVNAIDHLYRTVPSAQARALGGLSEGGYGAINIALAHPNEFHVVESWSGYERADPLRSIFGGEVRRIRENTPLLTLPRATAALRRQRAFFWFYSGTNDRFRGQNAKFAQMLARAGIPHAYLVVRGGHNWALWRANAARAYLAAASRLTA
jgi:enterochelin esterase-like enzyme